MTRRNELPADVVQALVAADRKPGWNNRSREVKRFPLGECVLYVVPYRCWAYRRQELLAAEWHRQREQG